MEIGYLQEVKAIIKSLVLSCPNAITVDKLNRDFRDVEGSHIPFRKLGFQTLEAFLRSIPDTVQVFGGGSTATVRIVVNEKSGHIHQMVRQQKRPKRSKVRDGIYRASHFEQQPNANPSMQRWIPATRPKPNCPSKSDLSVNLQFNHAVVKNPQRMTVKKCQAQEVPTMISQARHSTDSNVGNAQHIARYQQGSTSSYVRPNQRVPEPVHQSPNNSNPVSSEEVSACEILLNKCTVKDEPSDATNENQPSPSERPTPICVASIPKNISMNEVTPERGSSKAHEIFQTTASSEELKIINDMDEAVPAFAANNLVFRVDFPDNTMTFGKKIAPYKLPENVKCGSILGIFISEIHTPFKFWFHIHKENHELDSLMNHIERFYAFIEPNEFCIPRICICPGQVCAALYNGLWHRAEILSPVIKNKAKVLFVDYGTVSEVPVNGIKFLPTMFSHLPTQAIRGSLSYVQPRGLHWSPEATHHFLTMACELMLYGQVSEIDEQNRVVYMVLCDTNGSEVVQINKTLVEKGFATFDAEWLKSKSQKAEQRLRHLRDDFPTFSMLEMGDYPSFYEVVGLYNRGIDYEDIIDQSVYHPGKLNQHDHVPAAIRNLPFQLLTTNPFRGDILLQLHNLTRL